MKQFLYICLATLMVLSMTGCAIPAQATDEEINIVSDTDDETSSETSRPEGWSESSHSDQADPDYDIVFPQDKINRIDIEISEENWDLMLADMTSLVGEFGQSGGNNMRPGAQQGQVPPQGAENLPQNGQQPGNGNVNPGGGGNLEFMTENPVWVTATVTFEEDTWEYVGIRFKGNSSLRDAWTSGNYKLPFKLDFDQFEDEYPQIDDQRFYGFKQLSLANNFNDDSYLREKVTADIFREFGVPSAHTAFYEVYLDYGEGSTYLGLYTMVEMVEDSVISQQFSSDSGNLYKPDGTGATFAEGSFNEASFDKETNQEEADYSDIIGLFDVLHADTRLTQPSTWRNDLESILDVDGFLRWLAVNTVVQNWDTYGQMSHNYFLYTDPDTGLITWIPWDNNHALTASGGMRDTLSLSLDEVTDEWPLIRYLMDDPIYQAQYESYLSDVIETVFVPDEMAATYRYYHDLIEASALAETADATMLRSKQAFQDSVQELIAQVNSRQAAVLQYLSD
jgi:hypothetical protein